MMEPVELLQSVLRADEEARAALDQVTRRMDNADRDAEKLRAEEREKAMTAAAAQAEAGRTRVETETERKLQDMERSQAQNQKALADRWASQKDACAEKIFRAAVGMND